MGVQGGWSWLRKFRMGFPPVPAAAFRAEAARSSHVVGDFRAALGAEFLCHFGEVIELHDLAKLLCKIGGRTGQTNPKRCRKSGDFSRIPPCEICENSHERGRRSPGVRQKGCRVPPCPASGLGAVAVGDEAVFRPGLAVMAGLTESLPVGFVPEQFLVATMGDDVVDYRCRGQPSLLAAANAERVVQQEGFACRLPAFCVASAVSRGALRIGLVLGLMLCTVHPSGQVGAAGMVTRFPGSVGHGNASFRLDITSS